MYTNKQRWLLSLNLVHSEVFVEYKSYWVGNQGTIYNSKKRIVKSKMFRVDGVQTRRDSFIIEAWGVREDEKREEHKVIDLSKYQRRRNKNKGFRDYRRKVDELTNQQPIHLMKDIEKRAFREYNIDHIIPVRHCYDNGISEQECSNISNLQVISHDENTVKQNNLYCVISQCGHLKI